MTHFFTKTILTAGLSALLGSLTLNAQNLALTADIPFAFHAEGKVLPAGTYDLKEKGTQGIFQISDRAAEVSQFVSASIPKHYQPSESKLTFARYGNDYVLTEISVAGSSHSNGVSASAVEKNLTRKMNLSAMVSVALHTR
ncbi:MAG: hypothetical protein M3Y72_09510 [Acidobacteriota bacterium]|nr:hypothetical protein [Acidobacteriota bacterium]